MGNIMTSMYTGVSGLRTNQSSLNTVSHNLANINTDGYVRQQIVGADTIYNAVGQNRISMLQVGYGSTIQEIRQVRDVFLDKSYRLEIGRKEFYKAQSEATQEIETLFGELEGEAFHDEITDFWETLQELAKEPDSIVKRAAVVSQAGTLIERAGNIYGSLSKYQKNLNIQIQDKVDRINEIGEQIKELNQQIVRYETGLENANDLRDTRNKLLDELGEIVKIAYKEDASGNVNVSIEGRQFVWDNSVYKLTTEKADDAQGLLTVLWAGAQKEPLYDLTKPCESSNNTNVGSLKGILLARGNALANYTDIPVEGTMSDADFAQAVKKYNQEIEPSIVMSTMAQFDQLIHGMVTAINDVLCPNTSVSSFIDSMKNNMNMDTGAGFTIKMDGVEVDTSKVKVWDEANAPVGMDPNHTPRQELFERKYTERYTKATMEYTDKDGMVQTKDVYIYNEEDPNNIYSLYTVSQLQINNEIQREVSLLPLSGTANQGHSDAFALDKCKELVDVFNKKFATLSPEVLTKYTFADYYTAFVGNIATKGDMYESMATEHGKVADSIDNQRNSLLGVSSEEELTNMIRFQHAYGANSKYINVINEMLDTIINRMG